ncbi:redoxin domain-containing protein [Halomarina litorea]|uniref:redoxin domain-containing protein n=1 Tax=Halomarina litorea TaxID=2961595 RepID=UPI0020C5B27A|nr:redoxin domain-containing protein [Halomarina sp. BCD28]
MVSEGDSAPDIEAKVANGDVEDFTLSEHLDEAPVVLAFFPGAFTPPCTNEMNALQEDIDGFEEAGATIYGVSADSAFSLNAFRDEYDFEFDLVSDMSREAIEDYGLSLDVPELGLYGVANRAVFVVDSDGQVTYAWTADDPETEPDYEELKEAAAAV